MSGARVPFDTSLPFVVATSSPLPCGDRVFKRGDVFPWRDLNISERDLALMWIANQVDVDPSRVGLQLTPGERVAVETPKQERKRRARS